MIINRLRGGLGNQLFQYAFGRMLADKYSTNHLLDTTWYESEAAKQAGRKYQLMEFNITGSIASTSQIKIATRAITSNQKSWFGKPLWESKNDIPQAEFSPRYFNKQAKHILLEGYWQSENYFLPISRMLRQELSIKNQGILINEKHLLEKIRTENSVSVHIRRGDYLNADKNFHGVINVRYYQKAAAYINNHNPEPRYYIFSDDPDWCYSNLDFLPSKVIISANDQKKARTPVQELMLMAACKHQIIANSSFSWWGAWLNRNLSKQIVAPTKWFAGRPDLPDLIPDEWIRIENDF